MAETNLRIRGGAVRFGASYGGNKIFSSRGQGGAGGSLAFSKSFSMAGAGGAGLGMRARGGLGLGMGLGGGLGLGLGMGGGGAGAGGKGAISVGAAPLRARLGGRGFKIGGYGFNPSFTSSTARVDEGVGSSLTSIDPSLPSVDTVQVTRLKEKEELQVLNDKFASFIDKVRLNKQRINISHTY